MEQYPKQKNVTYENWHLPVVDFLVLAADLLVELLFGAFLEVLNPLVLPRDLLSHLFIQLSLSLSPKIIVKQLRKISTFQIVLL